MSFRGGKLYSKHSSSSLYGLWLRLLSEHGKHHACLHSLSPLPSPPRPHIKSCWQKLVGRIRSSLRTRVECLRWCEDKNCNYLIASLACLESLDLFQEGNLFYFTCIRLMFLRAFFFLVFWRHTPYQLLLLSSQITSMSFFQEGSEANSPGTKSNVFASEKHN